MILFSPRPAFLICFCRKPSVKILFISYHKTLFFAVHTEKNILRALIVKRPETKESLPRLPVLSLSAFHVDFFMSYYEL
ncbi:hypothetical protein DW020_10355 [Clostridium sp. AF37-5AT]|nr:hypothetical protein DW020_10355 [Clostridium sp. AF37-5AT]